MLGFNPFFHNGLGGPFKPTIFQDDLRAPERFGRCLVAFRGSAHVASGGAPQLDELRGAAADRGRLAEEKELRRKAVELGR